MRSLSENKQTLGNFLLSDIFWGLLFHFFVMGGSIN